MTEEAAADPSQPSIGEVRDKPSVADPAPLEAWFRANVEIPAEPLRINQFNRGSLEPPRSC